MLGHYIFVISTLVSTVVGLLVVYRNLGSIVHRLYGLLSISFIILAVANFLSLRPTPEQPFYVQTVMAATTIGVLLLYLLSNFIHNQQYSPGYCEKFLYFATLIVLIIDYSPLLFVEIIADSPARPVPGPGSVLYLAHFVGLASLSVYILFKGLSSSQHKRVQQSRLILAGVIPIIALAPLTGFILPLIFNYTQLIVLTPIYTLFFVCCVGYAMVRHGLFDIKFAAVRTAAYVMALVVLAVIYYFMAYIVSILLFRNDTVTSVSISPTNILLALVLAFMFQPIKKFFDRLTDNIFYRDRYSSEEFFDSLSRLLTSTTDVRGLLERASREISTTFKAEQVFFLLYYHNGTPHHMSAGTTGHARVPMYDAKMLDAYMETNTSHIFLTDTLPLESNVRRMLVSHRIELVMTLWHNGQIVGHVFLGDHRSGRYTKRDLKVLSTISNELVIAIQNALSLHEIKEINATLQQRIDVATKELRSSNAQLRHLDEVKDEFMSMASHQLRTPLTSIKGYLSMVLEEDMGKITPQQRTVLNEAFNSSERMVRLIADFLNVSRLQTGKFVIEKNPVNLVDVVKSEVSSLQMMATSHDMKLDYITKETDVTLMIDEAKVRQVIMNFVDNAIYYSRANSTIKVTLEVEGKEVAVRVIDTGIGVPAEEQQMLFNKFFRAKNARQQRPDGTGVGLYLARKVITAHGGKMIFTSAEGQGSTFGFRLPIVDLKAGSETDNLKD